MLIPAQRGPGRLHDGMQFGGGIWHAAQERCTKMKAAGRFWDLDDNNDI